ncbi:MAG: hypothetical protein CL917_08140 [Deltaproteobacteria bacterium]|nr:hypothetical protein [Deltaproteobacteria bacterium]
MVSRQVKTAKAEVLLQYHQITEQAKALEASNTLPAKPDEKSVAQTVFENCIADLKDKFYSYDKVKVQYEEEMRAVSSLSDSIDSGKSDVQKDKLIADFAAKKSRADQLKSIKDFKFSQMMEVIYMHYPDIAGSASSATSKKSYALHEYTLPDGILGSVHDSSIASSMIAGLLQIAQAWIEDFYMVAVFLKRIQDNDSPFKPVYASTFEDIKIHLGETMGQEAIEQMGKMWSIVVRGNQSIVEFNRNNPSLSKFRQITTGGNGEPERKSTVEPKNIISFVCYIVHHHDQGLTDRRRQMTAVMKNAYSLLSDGCIIKACTQMQKHWSKAMELQVKIDWYSLIHLGSDVLRHRCLDFWDKMTKWIESPEKESFSDNCLPKVNEWIADILSIAQRLTNKSPRKHVTQEISAAHASLDAYVQVLDGVKSTDTKSNHVDTTQKSDWVCGNVDCDEKILKAVKDAYLKRQEAKGNSNKSPPAIMGLLCPDCHQKHADGADIVLSDGNKKRHFQKLTEEQKEANEAVEKKKAKNKAKNERRKARKAEAKKKAEEEKNEQPDDDESKDKSKLDSSNESNQLIKKLNESIEALPKKLIALAAGNKSVSFADAEDVQEHDESTNSGGESSKSSVVKNLLQAYGRARGDVKANVTIAQGETYVPK